MYIKFEEVDKVSKSCTAATQCLVIVSWCTSRFSGMLIIYTTLLKYGQLYTVLQDPSGKLVAYMLTNCCFPVLNFFDYKRLSQYEHSHYNIHVNWRQTLNVCTRNHIQCLLLCNSKFIGKKRLFTTEFRPLVYRVRIHCMCWFRAWLVLNSNSNSWTWLFINFNTVQK